MDSRSSVFDDEILGDVGAARRRASDFDWPAESFCAIYVPIIFCLASEGPEHESTFARPNGRLAARAHEIGEKGPLPPQTKGQPIEIL